MIIFRLAIEQYKDDLSGTGAKLFGGRWNFVGIPVLYTTENIALSALEILVRTDKNLIPPDYTLLKIDLPESMAVNSISKSKLKKGWQDDLEYTQFIGSEFIKNNGAPALKVPSAIIEEEHNFIINPNHSEFRKIKIRSFSKFRFDKRFFKTDE